MAHQHRHQTFGEEIANAVTHGAGLLASLIALPVLLVAGGRGDGLVTVAFAVFATSLVLLYGASTLYHAVPHPPAKRVLRVIDHSAIYLLIAGTYTPFAMGVLRGPLGWSLLGVMWALAAAGIASKLVVGFRFPRLSTALYLMMGWMALIAIRPLWLGLPAAGLGWLLAGGLCYTGGVVFYVKDRPRFNHAVWHLFVLGGSICHFWAVLRYAVPAGT
ncbi:MAG: hemolysin III family protein [Gemmatimonadota bacterium]